MVPASPFASAGRYAFDNSPILPRWMTRSKITGEHAAMAGNVAVQPSGRFRERPVTVTAASGEFRRLSALITRQRRELDVMKSQAAARAVVDLARGVLMGRLDCSPAQAQAQLARLSQESRTSVPELAAQIAGQPSPEAAPEPAAPSAAEPGTSGTSGNALVSAAVELAADGGLESWWPAGNPGGETAPAIGHWPKGARAVIPLPGTGVALGAMEVCWPEPLAEFPDPMRRQLIALAEVCAQPLGVRLERGDPAGDHRAPAGPRGSARRLRR